MAGETDDVVGIVALTHSTNLVFSVRPWKGRMLAHVRKFVSGPKYEGPTKAGLTMDGAVLASVVDALTRLQAELPGPEETRFAELQKGAETDIVVTVVPPDNLKALPSVDVREHVHNTRYAGPTKKGVRFSWEKLPAFIGILEEQARRLSNARDSQSLFVPEERLKRVRRPEKVGDDKWSGRDSVLRKLLPEGPKDFPGEFLDAKETVKLDLPVDPISVVVLPGGQYTVQSAFGFRHNVRNPAEGNFIFYAFLRGHRLVSIPKEMIDVFRTVKGYENYLRDLRRALLREYERTSGHRPMAEHRVREVFKSCGLPWLD